MQKLEKRCLISCSPMPRTSFVFGCLPQDLSSDESKMNSTSSYPNPVAGSFSKILSSLTPPPPPESLSVGGDPGRGWGDLTWPHGVTVAALEGGLWNLSLAARNASCFPHSTNS